MEWIEAAANYVRIHTGQRVYSVREKISDFEQTLAPDKFVRIHRSLIVNLDAVSEIQPCGSGEYIVVLRDGRELPMGRTYKDALVSLGNKH